MLDLLGEVGKGIWGLQNIGQWDTHALGGITVDGGEPLRHWGLEKLSRREKKWSSSMRMRPPLAIVAQV